MLANKNYDKLSKCPACGFVAGAPHGQEKGKVEHCSHPSEQKGPEGHAAVRAASANGTTARPGPAAPKYGRKVFITDDEYLDRRASRMAAWEKAGAIQREPISNRSPSAPLPDKAPKWRTVDSARSLNAENGSD